MKVNRRRQPRISKWVIAGLAFILVMTVTFANVNGVNIPGNKGGGNSQSDPKSGTTSNYESGAKDRVQPNPAPVPEPATMILMALGLGAAALTQTKKKA